MIDFTVEKNFQLVLELWNVTADVEDGMYLDDSEPDEIIAIDSVKITYGPCSLLKKSE